MMEANQLAGGFKRRLGYKYRVRHQLLRPVVERISNVQYGRNKTLQEQQQGTELKKRPKSKESANI
ncbi:hypothetical protein ACFO25_14785 [Paenactinomyces guangxiensis]|uniref:Uncharacterized protein n=1 Tax=Paenactinomyces guangxiensis TaxID=1490290 RepID=A0A7W1WPY3_9BACL|nr:hypothetical protein [Paenactinomyces guangxiensis]MBA4493875.1 hypothetical protein [Paenactinomyces guangxiensis]MBH8591341.1 hypothetical protein [Paenactinomyces guangxiensis]